MISLPAAPESLCFPRPQDRAEFPGSPGSDNVLFDASSALKFSKSVNQTNPTIHSFLSDSFLFPTSCPCKHKRLWVKNTGYLKKPW